MDLEKVIDGRKQVDEAHLGETSQLAEQCQALELALEKQKIFVSAHKRDMETA